MTMVSRMVLAIPIAALVVLLLLLLMLNLIAQTGENLQPVQYIKFPDIYMPEQKIMTRRNIDRPKKPDFEQTPPVDIIKPPFNEFSGNAELGEITIGRIETMLDLGIGQGLQVVDGEYLPIVKIAPQYPRRALHQGIEGYVILEYTVTKLGTVKDPIIIEAKPKHVFDKAAIQSALRYKYKPRVINGEAVAVLGVRTRIIFQLNK